MGENHTIESYLAVVRTDLARLSARDRDEALAELESLVRADAARVGETAALVALGSPDEYAAQVLEALRGVRGEAEGEPRPQGRVLGMPYDFRGATVDRLSNRIWNPADPRVFMPRTFGLGWTFNFGAIAVKLGLIRPDDLGEDSYDRVPSSGLTVALAIPVALALAAIVIVALSWRGLPAEVPVHWNALGAPDDWGPKGLALGALLAIAVVPLAFSYARLLTRGASARSRLLTAAAYGVVTSLALGIISMTVADADGGSSGSYAWLGLIGALAVPFLMLYVPMRLGLRAEWRQSRDGQNGSV